MTDHTKKIRPESTSLDYDSIYSSGVYDRPYWNSHYYPLFKVSLSEVQRLGGSRILEVGCGSGSFAHLLFDKTHLGYTGFDFSENAIAGARLRTNRPEAFSIGDATRTESYQRDYDTVVCMEVLEHIEDDHGVICNWRPGCRCVCSVPNFDDPSHVRYFLSEDEIRSRYGGLIDIRRISRIPRPLLLGRSLREYFRQLRWSRDEPKRFFAHIGYKTFENLAGWFVFSGYRHATEHVDQAVSGSDSPPEARRH